MTAAVRAVRARRVAFALALLALLTGCASAAPAAPTLDDAVAERRAAIEAAERERFDAFVASSSYFVLLCSSELRSRSESMLTSATAGNFRYACSSRACDASASA